MKLGLKQRTKIDPRRLLLRNFRAPGENIQYSRAPDWGSDIANPGMKGNDIVGDCVPASAAHLIQCQREALPYQEGDRSARIADGEVMDLYMELTGYVWGDESTDNGMYLLDFMKHWKANPVYGVECLGYVEVDMQNPDEVAFAVSAFGGIIVGAGLPLHGQDDEIWGVPDTGFPVGQGAWSRGGHAFATPAISPGMNQCITWGYRQAFTPKWLSVCGSEAYAPITSVWADRIGHSPSGLDIDGLLAAATRVRET